MPLATMRWRTQPSGLTLRKDVLENAPADHELAAVSHAFRTPASWVDAYHVPTRTTFPRVTPILNPES